MGEQQPRRVALIGPRGAGKTTIAPQLGQRLAVPAWDLDAAIAAVVGREVRTFIEQAGWSAFRAVELETLAHLIVAPEFVIACGAGLVETPAARSLLSDATDCIIWLDLTPEQQGARLQDHQRPPLMPHLDAREERAAADGQRRPLYAALAHLQIDASAPLEKVLSDCLAG